jgi:hypothetical protein
VPDELLKFNHDEGSILVARIVIERLLTPDGDDIVQHVSMRPDGAALPVIEQLGMLALTQDSVMHAPDDDD